MKGSKKIVESDKVRAARKVRKDGKVYVLRTCNSDMTAYGGFKWPKRGLVTAPDWSMRESCGNGLHGALWGEGDGSLLDHSPDAVGMVVLVKSNLIVDLGGKVKFESGYVVFCGTLKSAAEKIISLGANGDVIAGTATAGDAGTATAGYAGTATAGNRGTATAGHAGTATAGYAGTATAGDAGTATAGNRGTATAGNRGTATAGDAGTATAGTHGTATAGDAGAIVIKMWDTGKRRYILRFANIGENGIKPNTPYKLNGDGEFVEVAK